MRIGNLSFGIFLSFYEIIIPLCVEYAIGKAKKLKNFLIESRRSLRRFPQSDGTVDDAHDGCRTGLFPAKPHPPNRAAHIRSESLSIQPRPEPGQNQAYTPLPYRGVACQSEKRGGGFKIASPPTNPPLGNTTMPNRKGKTWNIPYSFININAVRKAQNKPPKTKLLHIRTRLRTRYAKVREKALIFGKKRVT